MAVRFPSSPRAWVLILLLPLGTVLGSQAFWLVPDSLVVARYNLALPSWPKSLDGFSDLHGGSPFVDAAKFEEVVRQVSAAKPDLIVWLGEYVIQGVLGSLGGR